MHTQALAVVQVSGAVQVPQAAVRVAAQLSVPVTMPHVLPSRVQKVAFDSDVQPGMPQTPGRPPPPQVSAPMQPPQSTTERDVPQLSLPEAGPHETPSRAQS